MLYSVVLVSVGFCHTTMQIRYNYIYVCIYPLLKTNSYSHNSFCHFSIIWLNSYKFSVKAKIDDSHVMEGFEIFVYISSTNALCLSLPVTEM